MSGAEFSFAFLLDLLIGDPKGWPHPVRIIGKVITMLEAILRKGRKDLGNERIAGVVLMAIVAAGAWASTFLTIKFFEAVNPLLGSVITIFLAYTTIAMRDLIEHCRAVLEPLEKGDLETARKRLSLIVGRDTEKLDKSDISRAAIESAAENYCDGIVAPIFYLSLGGPALAMLFKAVSTLDSMVGHKNNEYIDFGWASARADDLLNYIPARLSSLFLIFTALLCGKEWKASLRVTIRDHSNHASPNSGYPEAAVAGALGIKLGGPVTYAGIAKIYPHINLEGKRPDAEDLSYAIELVEKASYAVGMAALLFIYLIW